MIRQPPRSPLFPYPTPFRSGLVGPTAPLTLKQHRRNPQRPSLRALTAGGNTVTVKDILDAIQSPESTPADFADRKSTRLNSSHANISYAVFCLKKKKYHMTH